MKLSGLKSVATLSAVLLIGVVGAGSAAAAVSPKASPAEVTQFESLLSQSARSDSTSAATLRALSKLSDAQQARFVAIVTGATPLDAPEIISSQTGTSIRAIVQNPPPAPALSSAAVTNWTATYAFNDTLFGITIGKWSQTYRYQSSNGAVISTQYCSGTFSGFSGWWNVSTSNSQWVSSGHGYCVTDFNGSFVYRGGVIQMNKRMTMVTNGTGGYSATLVND